MVDTPWMSIEKAAEALGLSRQAVTLAAREQLAARGLARRSGPRWEVEAGAVRVRSETGKWPAVDAGDRAAVDRLTTLLVEANERAESAVLHAALAREAELEARLVARDQRIEWLERELAAVRAEYRAMLVARVELLDSSQHLTS